MTCTRACSEGHTYQRGCELNAVSILEGYIATELIDDLTTRDPKFRVGHHTFRMAYFEEMPEEWADDEAVVIINPETGDLFEVEVEVFVRKLKLPEPKPEPVDPNQLTIDTTT